MLEKIENIAKEVCNNHGVCLYDLELINTQNGKVLCVYITKIHGVSISDCTNVSKELIARLDTEESLSDSFRLEVSSPGIERSLKLKKHYASAINEYVSVKLVNTSLEKDEKIASTPLLQHQIVGVLREVTQDYITIELETETVYISFNRIKKAKTIFKPNIKEKE